MVPDIGQVLVMALRTAADYQPTGVVLLADHRERQWSQQSLNATETLVDSISLVASSTANYPTSRVHNSGITSTQLVQTSSSRRNPKNNNVVT